MIILVLLFCALVMYGGIKAVEHGSAWFPYDWFTGLAFYVLGFDALFVGGSFLFFVSDYFFYMNGGAA